MPAEDEDYDQLNLVDEEVSASKLIAKGEVTGAPGAMNHGDRFYFVGRGEVDDMGFPRKKGLVTRVHKGTLDRAVYVDQEVAREFLDADEEMRSAAIRILTPEGETRVAARLAAAERRLAAANHNYDGEYDDAENDEESFARLIKDQARKALDMDAATFDAIEQYLQALETEWAQTAGLALAAIEWTRRRRAALVPVTPQSVTVDGSGTALTEEEAAEARGDTVPAPEPDGDTDPVAAAPTAEAVPEPVG